MVNLREEALQMLGQVVDKGAYSHTVLRDTLMKYQYLSKQERAFMTRLFEGTLEYLLQLDYIISRFSKTPIQKLKPLIRNILRLGVYQLRYMDQVPDRAACDEAVKSAKKHGYAALSGFVNGVMRTAARNIGTVTYPDRDLNADEYLSIRYSAPLWMVQKWLGEYGFDTTEGILEASITERPVSIRCNQRKITTEELRRELEEQGITVGQGSYLPYALTIRGYDYLDRIPGFRTGAFFVQDESSMLAAEAGDPQPGALVVDVCAAPGGKALHCLEKMQDKGLVLARDISQGKTDLIRENAGRLGICGDMLRIEVWDACTTDETLLGKADLVMADLPCSGLGVLSKKSDIKYRMTIEQQEELILLQRRILSAVKEYVKPGGALVYSTCTINRGENEENASWFVKDSGFELESFGGLLPGVLRVQEAGTGMLQMLPGQQSSDGFFIAKFRRKGV